MPSPTPLPSAKLPFGALLKHLRKRAGMTQRDLAAALNYSDSFISSLEKDQRQPDVDVVMHALIPALGLQDDPNTAAWLIERAAAARGERPPASIPFQVTSQSKSTPHSVLPEDQAEHVPILPAAPTQLIGRSEEITQLCHRLLGQGGRLLTLVGPPGIGKTTLALAVMARLQHHFADGMVFVALAAISEPMLMASAIASLVGCNDAGPKAPKAKLMEFLRRKTLLLVLDNLEQIQGAAPLIAELIAECPALCILATSRERLHLRAEQRFKVPPLAVNAAVELFTQRAQTMDADFCLTADNTSTVEAICQRLDCLPLAIELCVAQIDLLSPAQLLIQLQDHRLDLLVEGAHDLPPRQRTLRNAIEHSYQLLNAEERELFCSLGVFAGGFDLPAVAAVSNWDHKPQARSLRSTLHALINKNLVRAETQPSAEPRFLLLETIREFALAALVQLPGHALDETRQRHAKYYADYFGALRRTADLALLFQAFDIDQHNVRAALRWLIDHKDTQSLMLLNSVGVDWTSHTESRRWLSEALTANLELTPIQHNGLLSGASLYAWQQHDFEAGLRYGYEALAVSRAMNSQAHIADDLIMLSCIYIEMDNCVQAKEIAIESLQISRSIQNPELTAGALTQLGEAELTLGEVAQAAACFEEAYALCQAPDFRQYIYAGLACKGMGEIAFCHHDYERALEYLRQGLRHSPIAGHNHCWMLNPLAGVIGTRPGCTTVDVYRAVKIWGATEALGEYLATALAPVYRRRTDVLISEVRTRIDPQAFDAAWAEGRELSFEQAIALAMM